MTRLRFTIFLIMIVAPIIVQAGACNQTDSDTIQLSVHIPGLTNPDPVDGKPCYYLKGGLPQYIAGIYNFGLMVAGFLAMVMIMIGGFMYIAAGGNQTIIGKAKERIVNAIVGLVLLLLAYTILNTINPELVSQTKSRATLKEKVKPAPAPGTTTSPAAPAAPPPPAEGS